MTDKSNTQAAKWALIKREVFDAIRGAYDLGYNDARNARTAPGDGAPGYKGRDVEADHGGALLHRLDHLLAAQPTPELSFAGIAARKLDDLKAQGYMVDGYSIQHTETKQRGFITSGGFVGWWVNKDHVQPGTEPVAPQGRDELDKLTLTITFDDDVDCGIEVFGTTKHLTRLKTWLERCDLANEAIAARASLPAPQAEAPQAEAPVKVTPYNPTEAMRWAMKGIDPALSHDQCRALWSAAWAAAPASPPAGGVVEHEDEMFELWWADHMPKATRDQAWAEWRALRNGIPASPQDGGA